MTSWVRLWHDMPTDPKWRVIAKKSGQKISEVIAVFNFIMINASANATERGRTHNLFSEDIAAALDMETDQINNIINAMLGKIMDSSGRLMGWEKRQPKREDNSAERAKKWRSERNRTQPNATERPETETETETETERDGDFDAWYSVYPHKIGKAAAKKAFRAAIKKIPLTELISAVERYQQSKPHDRPWCNPATWLNQERWDDQPQEIKNGASQKQLTYTERLNKALDDGIAELTGANQPIALPDPAEF